MGTAMASAPATGPLAAWADTWSARGTRKASGATAVVAVAAGPSSTNIEPGRGNGSVPVARGWLSFRSSARKSASWRPVSMSEARWPSSWGRAVEVASRAASFLTSSPRSTSGAPASTASSWAMAVRSASAPRARRSSAKVSWPSTRAPASSRTLRTPSRRPLSTLSVSTSTTERPLSRSWTSSGMTVAPKACRRACSCLRATFSLLLRSLSWRTRSLVARRTETVPSWSTVLPTTMPRARARNTATSDTMW